MMQKPDISRSARVSRADLLDALKEHLHAIVLSSSLLAVAGVIVVSLVPDVYRATTTILVDPQKIPERYVTSTVTSDPNERLNTLMQQVLSTPTLEKIVEEYSLYPQMRARRSREEIFEHMRSKVTIELKQAPEQALSTFTISFEDNNRAVVAPVANRLAFSFINWNLSARQQQALGTTQFLSVELEEARRRLEDQENRLQAFKMEHAGATPDQLDGNLQVLARLQADVESHQDAISRLEEERILLLQVRPAYASEVPERERLLQEKHRLEAQWQELRMSFTDNYPDVLTLTEQIREIDKHLAATPDQQLDSSKAYDPNTRTRISFLESQIERHKQQIDTSKSQIANYQAKVESVPMLEAQLAKLTRDYDVSKQTYQSLLDKTLSASMSEDLEVKQKAERFSVLEPAKMPEKPAKPKRFPLIAGVFAIALLMPAGATLAITMLSGTVRSADDVGGLLPFTVPVLGTVPRIVTTADQRQRRILSASTLVVAASAVAILILLFSKVSARV